MTYSSRRYKSFVSGRDTIQIQEYKSYDKNVKIGRQLIPTHFLIFLPVILGNQDKWNLVFEKIIEKIDRLELNQPTKLIEVKEQQ